MHNERETLLTLEMFIPDPIALVLFWFVGLAKNCGGDGGGLDRVSVGVVALRVEAEKGHTR